MAKTATAPAPKTKAKPAPKAAAKPAAEKEKAPGEFGATRSKDLPWGEKKVAVLNGLKKLKAFDEKTAKGAGEIAEAAGVTNRDVRHYSYHAAAGGLVNVFEAVEGTVGYRFALTAEARKLDFDKEWAKQIKEKEAAKAKPAKKEKE